MKLTLTLVLAILIISTLGMSMSTNITNATTEEINADSNLPQLPVRKHAEDAKGRRIPDRLEGIESKMLGDNPFEQRIGFLASYAAEPKDEYVDYDLTLLAEHFKELGWSVEVKSVETHPEDGDQTVRLTFNKDKNIRATITSYLPNKNYAAANFLDELTNHSSAIDPDYRVMPKEKGVGTLTVYYAIRPTTIHWYYRNIYVAMDSGGTPPPTDFEIDFAVALQKVFNEHTKKIGQ